MQSVTSAQVLALLVLHLGGIAVVAAYCAGASALFPAFTERGAALLRARLWLPALLGLLISIPWIVACAVLMNRGGFAGTIGVILGLGWILVGLVGCSAIASVIGSAAGRMPHDLDQPAPLRAAFLGGALLALTWALPLIGWYFVLPVSLATGVGCVALAGRSKSSIDDLTDGKSDS